MCLKLTLNFVSDTGRLKDNGVRLCRRACKFLRWCGMTEIS